MRETARILVVADDPLLGNSLCAVLRGDGYRHLRICEDGNALLAQLLGAAFDLVVFEVVRPDASGLRPLFLVRQAGIEVPVIVVSGDHSIDSPITALRLGADDYVRRPCDPAALLDRIDAALGHRSRTKARRRLMAGIYRSERIHRLFVDSSADLTFMLDPQYAFHFVNEYVAQQFGYSAAELDGQPFLNIVFSDDLERARYALERAMQNPVNVELRFAGRCEGDYRHFSLRLIPVDFSDAHPLYDDLCYCGICVVARDISDQKQNDDHLAYLAYHDVLTGLPNRALFRDRVRLAMIQTRRNGGRIATMFADVDGFKAVNDTFGHHQGDELLKQIAVRLQGCLRETDTLARIGGDEFTVLLTGLYTRDDAGRVARLMVNCMRQPFRIGDCEIAVAVSVGVSIFPDDSKDIEGLLHAADLAMYEVKRSGRNDFAFFGCSAG